MTRVRVLAVWVEDERGVDVIPVGGKTGWVGKHSDVS